METEIYIPTEIDIEKQKERHEARQEFEQDLITIVNLMKGKFGWDNEDILDFMTDIMHFFDYNKKNFELLKKEYGVIFALKYFHKRVN